MQKTAQMIAHEVLVKVAAGVVPGSFGDVDPQLIDDHIDRLKVRPLLGGMLGASGLAVGLGSTMGRGPVGRLLGGAAGAAVGGLTGVGLGQLTLNKNRSNMEAAPYNEGYANILRKSIDKTMTPEEQEAYNNAYMAETQGDLSTWDQFK